MEQLSSSSVVPSSFFLQNTFLQILKKIRMTESGLDDPQNIEISGCGFQADKEPARVKDSRLLACPRYRLCVQGSTEEARSMHGST